MPALPEITHGEGEIGRFEVHHQLHTHHLRAAPGDVGIAAEVAVNLQGKGCRGQGRRAAGGIGNIVIHRVRQPRQVSGTHALFEKAPDHEPDAMGGLVIPENLLLFELRQEVIRPLDGTGHQLGEVGHEQSKGYKVPLRLHLAPVHIDGVAESLEGIKGYANRQDDVQSRGGKGDAHRPTQGRKGLAKEIQVFEEKQKSEVNDQVGNEHRLFGPGIAPDAQGTKIIDRCGKQDQHDKLRLPAHIKIVTGRQEQIFPKPMRQGPVEDQHRRQKDHEFQRIEKHLYTASPVMNR